MRGAPVLLYCFFSAKITLEKGAGFSSHSASFSFVYNLIMKAQEHSVSALLWSGPAATQHVFCQVLHAFFAFFSAASPLCSQTPPLCVTHDP